jgi:Spherulation-specific family 4
MQITNHWWLLTVLVISNWLVSGATVGLTEQKIVNQSASHKHQLQILLPLYIYPNWYDKRKYAWRQVIAAAKKVPIVAIINPNSGPNNAPPNTDYQQGIKDLHQAGVKILGYVPSSYAKRDLQAVKADIDLYTKHFQVDGIFIDEAASSIDQSNYYRQIYQYIKARSTNYNVVINPGVNLTASYLTQQVADTIVTFENYHKNWSKYQPITPTKNYSARNFAALVHTTVDRQQMKSTLDRAIKNRFGYIYITDDSTNTPNQNPWDTLPQYWQAEVNYIQKLNAGK